jgi:hypothetical protein
VAKFPRLLENIDTAGPAGARRIDEFLPAHHKPWRFCDNSKTEVECFREEVFSCWISANLCHPEQAITVAARNEAITLISELETIQKSLEKISRLNEILIATEVQTVGGLDRRKLRRLPSIAGRLAQRALALRSSMSVRVPPRAREDVFSAFLRSLARAWEEITEEAPRLTRSGRFARLVTAACEDLGIWKDCPNASLFDRVGERVHQFGSLEKQRLEAKTKTPQKRGISS